MPASRAIAPTVAGLSPDSTFSATSSAAKNATVSVGVVAQPLGQHDDRRAVAAARAAARRARPAGSGASAAREREHAAAGGGLLRRRRSRSAPSRAVEQRLGRAEHEPVAVELERAPAAPRGERDLRGRLDARRRRRPAPPRGPPRASRCATARSRRSGRARAPARASLDAVGRARARRPAATASVSVPVLSVHMTETDASDSIALSCWASTPRRAIFAAETAAVSETSRISPSGTMLTIAAVSVSTAWAWLTSRIASEIPSAMPSGTITADEDDQQPVHRLLQRRARVAEGARRRRQPGGAAVGADGGRLEVARRPRPRTSRRGPSSPAAAQHRLGLAGQVRLVERQPVGAAAACRRRRSGRRLRRARGRRRRPRRSAPSRGSPSRTTVAVGATSAASLSSARFARTSWNVPIADVREQDPEEERVLGFAEDDRRGAEDREDQVEDRERVRDRDRAVGAAGRLLVLRPRALRAAASPPPRSARSRATR